MIGSPDAKRAIFTSMYTSGTANSGATGAAGFAASCKGFAGGTTSGTSSDPWSNRIGNQWFYSYPLHVAQGSYQHTTAPNTVPCNNPADPSWLSYGGPLGGISATSNHAGGVNVCLTDGSVKFVKDTVSLPTWWAVGTRAGGEVVGGDF